MGIINSKKKAKTATTSAPVPTPTPSDNREAIRFSYGELQKANKCVAELQGRIEVFNNLVAEEAASATALENAIRTDGGASLQRLAEGDDTGIGGVIAQAEKARQAAIGAKAALPILQQQVEQARGQIEGLEVNHQRAVREFLLLSADKVGKRYREAFDTLCRLYDEMTGISNALPPLEKYADPLARSTEPLSVPNFSLASVSLNASDYQSNLVYESSSWNHSAATSAWLEVEAALRADPEASIELIK